MSPPSVAILPSFVRRARRHLQREGRPLLCAPRRNLDTCLLAQPNPASLRWVLLLDPMAVLFSLYIAAMDASGKEMMTRLARYAVLALDDLPTVYTCERVEVGRLEFCDGIAFVSDAVTLSCLSWVLRHEKTGFYVQTIPER